MHLGKTQAALAALAFYAESAQAGPFLLLAVTLPTPEPGTFGLGLCAIGAALGIRAFRRSRK